MNYSSAFRERLANLREQRDLSQRALSLKMAQSENYINHIENGLNFPTMENFFHICEYLGITPKEFFEFEAKDLSLANELAEEIRGLEPKHQAALLSIVRDLKKARW